MARSVPGDAPGAGPAAPEGFSVNGSKLCRPEGRVDAVLRRRFVERLRRETAHLVVVSAPSGAGKTIGVSQWLEAEERPAVWVHLDRGDNDPVTLLIYLARALEQVAPVPAAVHSWLRLPQPPLAEAIVPALVAAAAADPFVVVLDDAHQVRDPRSWAAAWPILSAASTVVVCGRTDPPLPLARLRAEGRLATFGLAELAFSRDEVAELLRLRGLAADVELAAELLEATEGWAAGLYLAAAALERQDAPAPPLLPGTARREMTEYLIGEVLSDQPDDLVEFLTRTSILERLTPELCDALTGHADALEMLRRAERENLFVVRLDGGRDWYRYHHLFAEVLQAELGRRDPQSVAGLHRRAAGWYEQKDQVRHAVRHLLAAGEMARAGDLVAARWLSRYDTGRLLTARLWLDEFGPGQESAYPPLTITAAWLRALTGEPEAACHLLGALDAEALDAPSPDGTASLRSSAAMIDALLGSDGPEATREQAWRAARLERDHGRLGLWLDFANHIAGVAESLCRDPAAAVEPLELAARRGQAIRSSIELAALGHLSLIAADEGRWEQAEQYAMEAAAKSEVYDLEDYVPSVPARIARDRVSAHRGDDDAVADLEDLLDDFGPRFLPWVGPQVALALAEIAIDRGQATGARRWLREARRRTERWAAPALVCRCDDLARRLAARALPEPVSPAELRVLELLPTHLTVAEIAERLAVSPNTVGSHVRSLHRKLGATSRSETVERALDVGWLAPRRPATDD
jgi:LuxR family maltose regulon positive regulatory protein